MHIKTILPPKAVIGRLDARDKKHALKLLSFQASKLTELSEREIYSVLAERENIGCTGMGNGVCIPHGRFSELKSIGALFAILERPVDFGAADGKPVDLVFVLLSPVSSNTEHLKALATISRLLRDRALCEALRKTQDAQAIHALLISDRGEDAA